LSPHKPQELAVRTLTDYCFGAPVSGHQQTCGMSGKNLKTEMLSDARS